MWLYNIKWCKTEAKAMHKFTIHTSWGEITLDLDSARDNAYFSAVSAPASTDARAVRQLANEVDPNTTAGLHLFTRLASAEKLGSPIDIGIVARKVDPLSFAGLRTTEELKKRAVLKHSHQMDISARFEVDDFLDLASEDVGEVEKFELIAPMVRLGILTENRVDEIVSKINIRAYDNVEILGELKANGILSDRHLEIISERLDISDFDLTDENDVAVLDSLYDLGVMREPHLMALRAGDPTEIADAFFLEKVGMTNEGFGRE